MKLQNSLANMGVQGEKNEMRQKFRPKKKKNEKEVIVFAPLKKRIHTIQEPCTNVLQRSPATTRI